MTLRAVLIDLDGVIRLWHDAYDDGLMAATGLTIETIGRIAFAEDLLPLAVTGQISDGEWRDRVRDRLVATNPAIDGRAAVAAWSRPIGRVNEPVLKLVAEWRERAAVALITNATSRLPDDLAALGLTQAFDVIINSSAIGVAKPDPAIFRYTLEQLGVLPGDALFIDDTASHIAAARDVGLAAFHFTGDGDRLRAFVANWLDRSRGEAGTDSGAEHSASFRKP